MPGFQLDEIKTTKIMAEDEDASKNTTNVNINESDNDSDEIDKEFNIPKIEAPTLDSIMNQSDDDDDNIVLGLLPNSLTALTNYDDSNSVSSYESVDVTPKRRKKPLSSVRSASAILRHIVLKSVSAQLSSAADRVSAGSPTVLASGTLLAVGTSHGLVLVFDPNQTLKWCLGSSAVGAQYGAVTSLAFDSTCTRLLCGFAKSVITMWDTVNGKLIRTIQDAHPPGNAILNLQFTDSHALAVSSDSGGSVFELEFKRLIGLRSYESRCLFSGARGEVCCVRALHIPEELDHPLYNCGILAMGTLSKLLLVTLKPNLKVVYAHKLLGPPTTLPLLAWKFVVIELANHVKSLEPVLAFARDNIINFVQLICCKSNVNIEFNKLKSTKVDFTLLNIAWLNTRVLILLDTTEKFHIFDVRSEYELDMVDVAEIKFVYSSSFYKSLATGGNVSKAMACAADVACYGSISTNNKQLFLLGINGVHVYTLRTWKERIDAVVKTGHDDEAIRLACSFYTANRGETSAVLGLPSDNKKRCEIVSECVIKLASTYVDGILKNKSKLNDEEFCDEFCYLIIESHINVCRLKELVVDIYLKLENFPIAKKAFLSNLEPFIVTGRAANVGPTILRDLIEFYESTDQLHRLEACLKQVDMASIDTNHVVQLCWKLGLYDAFISVYNRALLDYTTPIEKIAKLLMKMTDETSDKRKLGNKLLVYLSCCLTGISYPLGEKTENIDWATIKIQSFNCLTSIHSTDYQRNKGKSGDNSDDEDSYPFIRSLLAFDTTEFFNVLSLACRSEDDFNGKTEKGAERLQRLIDILIRIIVEGEQRFLSDQIASLFTFVTRTLARNNNVLVKRGQLEQLLLAVPADWRATPGGQVRHDEREQALQELLDNGGDEYFDQDRLLELCEHAKFYKVCKLIYKRRRRYGDVWLCLWNDLSNRDSAFNFVFDVLMAQTSMEGLTEMERNDVKEVCRKTFKEMVGYDVERSAKLVMLNLFDNIKDAEIQLKGDNQLRYIFLKTIVQLSPNQNKAIHNDLIELMLSHDAKSVFNHLKLLHQTGQEFNWKEALNACVKYNNVLAIAYLYEIDGRLLDAYEILFKNVENSLTSDLSDLQKNVDNIADLCKRHSKILDDDKTAERLWFRLLDLLLDADELMKKENVSCLADVCQKVLHNMLGHVQLSDIVKRLMKTKEKTFSEIRPLLTALLANYNYETNILNICKKLIESDAANRLVEYKHFKQRSIKISNLCSLCSKLIKDKSITFKCLHTYHASCIQEAVYCRICFRKKPIEQNENNMFIKERFHNWRRNSMNKDENETRINRQLELRLKPPPPHLTKL